MELADLMDKFDIESDDRAVYPIKHHVGAATKVNLFFRDVYKDVRHRYPDVGDFWWENRSLTVGMANDEATGWLIWLCCSFKHFEKADLKALIGGFSDNKWYKTMSNSIKALGLSTVDWANLLVETVALRGRGVDVPDPWEDIRCRVDERKFVEEKSCGIGEEIRDEVKKIISEELRGVPIWDDAQDVWDKRWLYTKAGAHSQFAEKHILGERLDLPEMPSRREFVENVEDNIIASGTPRTDTGLSWKLEQGKTRAIYSCDTRSYMTFDYLLKPVEKKWANRSVLLNPGSRSEVSLFTDVMEYGDTRLMLDYDDFNSQHSIEAMQVVVEECCRGAPVEVVSWALASLNETYLHWHDGEQLREEKMVGTLPSGHRATSFINTILNAAYVRHVCDATTGIRAFHTGDDIVMSGDSSACERVLRGVIASKLRTNPSKQAIGPIGEFLRVGFGRDGARGYTCRAISTLVSGNWVSDVIGSQKAIATNLVSGFWNVAVRSKIRNIGLLGETTLKRRCPAISNLAQSVLRFELPLDGGASWDTTGLKGVRIVMDEVLSPRKNSRVRKSYATQRYLEKYIDFEAMSRFGISLGSLKRLMQDASYKPEVRETTRLKVRIEVVPHPLSTDARRWSASDSHPSDGIVNKLTVWANTPERRACVRFVSAQLGVRSSTQSYGCWNDGTLPWSSLTSIARRTNHPSLVYTGYPVRK
jgi:hypothetical protein